MTTITNDPDVSSPRIYIDEMASVQSSIQQLHLEFARLRNEARTDGFNMEAVQTLAQIIAKSPHDGGQGLLRDIFNYARKIGIELDTVAMEVDATASDKNNSTENESASTPRRQAAQTSIDTRLILLTQLGLGLGVAWMFISLLK